MFFENTLIIYTTIYKTVFVYGSDPLSEHGYFAYEKSLKDNKIYSFTRVAFIQRHEYILWNNKFGGINTNRQKFFRFFSAIEQEKEL